MKQEIKLYIEGREIEFAEPPAVLFTYTENDLSNPTIVKNHYTKTITIEGTPSNDDVFGHIWDLSRLTNYAALGKTQTGYNATKKAQFELFVNGEIYESGYVKLNKINKVKRVNTYDITLYGGIGDAFYVLSYDKDGNKLKLSDLTYLPAKEEWYGTTLNYPEGDEHEFDFVVSKETLDQAWNCINWEPDYDSGEEDSTRHWKYLNFAPCYNGNPEFDTDKVLINFNNAAIISTASSGSTEYGPIGGYGMGTLPEKMDEWAVRDLRSYLQRPVLRVKGFFNGIKKHLAENGYELDLSPQFFNESNPYYESAWMTLPQLTDIRLQGTSQGTDSTTEHTWTTRHVTVVNHYNTMYVIEFTPDFPLKAGHIDLDIDFIGSAYTYFNQNMFSSAFVNGERNFSAYAVQLVALAGTDWTSDKVAASPTAWLTSKVGDDYLRVSETYYVPNNFDTNVFPVFGYFKPIGNNRYEWSEKFTLSMDLPSNARGYAIMIQAVANLTYFENYQKNFWGQSKLRSSGYTYGYRQERYYTAQYLSSTGNTNSTMIKHYPGSVAGTATAILSSETAGYSGAHINKKLLLDTKYTPAEYLLSFTKQFGLYYLKNTYDNIIHLMTRDEFYLKDEVVDIDNLIDRGSGIDVNPEAFESKYYDFALNSVSGDWSKTYEARYSRVYGSQRVDTGYEFETKPKEIFSGNCFNSCVCGVQKSKYYLAPLQFAPSNEMPAYVLQNFKYNLYHYNQDNRNYDVYDADISVRTWDFEPLKDEKYYDFFYKPQFRDEDGKGVNGENCLLFFNGYVDMVNDSGRTIPYWITDDMRTMAELNDGNACWLYTESEYDSSGDYIAVRRTRLPQFSRYITNAAGTIMYSLDFGEPKQLFAKNISTIPTSTLYAKYWQNYIEDMYNADTRVVNALLKIEQRPNPEYLRRFYWFDNSLWRLNKITDYNITSFDTTKCEFVKVHYLDNYGQSSVSSIEATANKYTLAATGDTVLLSIKATGPWEIGGDWYAFESLSATGGTGDTVVTLTINSNGSAVQRDVRVRVASTEDTTFSDVVFLQEASAISLSVTMPGTLPYYGGTYPASVDSTLDWHFLNSGGLYTATPYSGTSGTTQVSIAIPANTDTSPKEIQIAVQNEAGAYARYYTRQEAQGAPSATITPSGLTVPKEGGTFTVTAITNFDGWETYTYGTYTPQITPTSGNAGETVITYTFPPNTGNTDATGTTSISYSGYHGYGYFHWTQKGPSSWKYRSGRSTAGWDQYNIAVSSLTENGFLDVTGGTVTPLTSLFSGATRWITFSDDVACVTNSAFTNARQEVVSSLYGDTASVGTMEVPSSVTAVTNYAFAEVKSMTAITLEGVYEIGLGAFMDCSGLTYVTLSGNTLQTLGSKAFKGCTSLQRIDYGGTCAEWSNITKASDWTDQSGFFVQCTDGQMSP